MLRRTSRQKRAGSVLVEYALLIAGVALVCVLAVAVLGHKTFHVYGVMADIIPGAAVDDNQPIRHVQTIPLDTTLGKPIKIQADGLVKEGGLDRMGNIFDTPNAGNGLIVDHD